MIEVAKWLARIGEVELAFESHVLTIRASTLAWLILLGLVVWWVL
jgi:hypothetical protein